MARKIPVKLIMHYRDQGFSRSMIAKTQKVSRGSVREVFNRAEQLSLSYEDVKDKSEMESYRIFFPERYQSEILYKLPDYEAVHTELQKVGVTLKLLWQEYVDGCQTAQTIPVGYTKFCQDYQKYTDQYRLTNHLKHKPGVTAQVDWSGATMQLVDIQTGEIIPVYLFVGVLPYSQFAYVEPTLDMKSDTWLKCHVNLFDFYGGTSVRLICDNLKTGVIKHPKEGDIILNEQYESLASHYVMAVMPAQVRKPKQKAAVEGVVGDIATAVIATLRHEIFTSLSDLKLAVREKLDQYNAAPFQKREGSRLLIFQTVERVKLRPLPLIPYEIAHWVYGRKVKLDCHITFEKNNYSCPYQYVRKAVDLKVSDTLLEIYHQHERIATHTRFPSYMEYAYATQPEHLPDQFKQPEWNAERMLSWAEKIGPHVVKVIQRVFERVQIKEQGYQSCLSVLNLTKKYSDVDLDKACQIALERVHSPRYRQLNAILTNPVYKGFFNQNGKQKDAETIGYIRGSEYYGGIDHD